MDDDYRRQRNIGVAGCRVLRDLAVNEQRHLQGSLPVGVPEPNRLVDVRRRVANLDAVIAAYERDMELGD